MSTGKDKADEESDVTSSHSNVSDLKTLGTFQAAELSKPLATELTPCNGCGMVIMKENAETDNEGKKYCTVCWRKRAQAANQQNQPSP